MIASGQPLDAKSYRRWQKAREGGKTRFVLLFGVAGWGLLTALLFSMIPLLFGNSFDWFRAALAFVLFPVGGIFWGTYMWSHMEKRYAAGPKEPVA